MGKKIFIVEDEALIALSLRMELRDFGYDVCAPAGSGQEALARVEAEKPDVVLLDICLGRGLDGIETAAQIQRKWACAIIFMTGYQDQTLLERARQMNPVAIFQKPAELADLCAAIDSA